jgi:hypothetical protein
MVAIVIVVIVLTLLGAAYGIYSRRGSDINAHPKNEEAAGDAPGTDRPDHRSSRTDPVEGDFDSHGTR